MTNDVQLRRVSGLLAVLGGAAWVTGVLVHASQPSGCLDDECLSATMRESTVATSWLVAVAGVLLDAVLLAIPFGVAWAATGAVVAASRVSTSGNRVSSGVGRL